LVDVEVVLHRVIRYFGIVGRDELLEGVVVYVADGHLPRVDVLDAHLPGVDGNLPRVNLRPAVVVEDIGDVRLWQW